MRILAIFFCSCLGVWAATSTPLFVGFNPTNAYDASAQKLNTAANAGWFAESFISPTAKTLNTVGLSITVFGTISNTSLASATYVSGGTFSGTGNCTLGTFNNSLAGGAAASIAVSSGTPGAITVTTPGAGATSAPTSATVTTGTATCSGTVTITSTLGSEMELDIYTDHGAAAPAPNAAIGNVGQCISVTTSANSGTNVFITWSGFSCAISANTLYWAVLKGNNASPTVNYPQVNWGGTLSLFPMLSNATRAVGSAVAQNMLANTVNSGGTWSALLNTLPFRKMGYSDGSYSGAPFTTLAMDTTNKVYAARENGNVFTSWPVQMNVVGISATVQRLSTPNGNVQFGLWTCGAISGSTLSGTCTNLGYTQGWVDTTLTTTGLGTLALFSSTINIPANSTVVVTLSDSSGNTDTSSIAYEVAQLTVDNTASSKALLPFNGTTAQVYCTATCTTGTNWTVTTTLMDGFALMLDPAAEVTAVNATIGSMN